MKVGAAFAADVAHACITMYVWDDNPKFLYIYHQELPRTQFLGELPDKTGRELRGNEEPLVQRALQRGVPLSGKRELSLGLFVDLRVCQNIIIHFTGIKRNHPNALFNPI